MLTDENNPDSLSIEIVQLKDPKIWQQCNNQWTKYKLQNNGTQILWERNYKYSREEHSGYKSNAMQGQYTNCHIIATIFGVERFENDRSRYV